MSAIQHLETIVTWFENKEEELEILGSLRAIGYYCISCSDKKNFLEITSTINKRICLIIIDLSLQEDDAISICNEIKNRKGITNHPFIIIISGTKEEYVQIMALDLGADDYIIKPIKPRVFLKRIVVIISRKGGSVPESNNKKEKFLIDPDKYLVTISGMIHKLPRKDFELIKMLYNEGQKKTFSREEIAAAIWGDETISRRRTIDIHIFNIRQILGYNIVKSVKGIGYTLNF